MSKDKRETTFLPIEQSEKITIHNGYADTTFHARGITLKGALVEDATENSSDRGARLTIHSSHGARNSNFGEGLRMVVDTSQAKNMIAWYDGFSRPGKITPKAWIGYHHGTYPDIVHDHISIETPNGEGALHTRFGVSTKRADVTNVDFNMSDVQITASQGGALRLAVGRWRQTKYPRDLVFATGISHGAESRRWALRTDTTAEAGENEGSLFRIVRYGDSGNELSDEVLTANRRNGHIAIGCSPHPSFQVNVTSKAEGIRIVAEKSPVQGLLRLEAPENTSSVVSVRKSNDVSDRFRANTVGQLEWGTGDAEPDVNLRRGLINGNGVLATNSDIYFPSPENGPILKSPNGSLFRLHVSDGGKITAKEV